VEAASRERKAINPEEHDTMKVAGLYSGIGGLELGFKRAGFETSLLCEIDPICGDVLRRRFEESDLIEDVRDLRALPRVDVLTAGFPCTSFSQVGTTSGLIAGRPYIKHIFRLLDATRHLPEFLVFENVPFMVHLDEGAAIRLIVSSVTKRGYSWAYRILDTLGFGIPQRRRRWIFLAAKNVEAASILFGGDRCCVPGNAAKVRAHGFYWTEGTRGIGWADNAIPPLKTGSAFGIPSPPAIWNRETGSIFTPSIRDAERLQGFPSRWTSLARNRKSGDSRLRWRLLGNAVSVPIAEWIARRILNAHYSVPEGVKVTRNELLPQSAHGRGGAFIAVDATERPSRHTTPGILDFLKHDGTPLSARATRGFRTRLEASPLRKDKEFLAALKHHERTDTAGT
jgi:DNA (cytosine-5)-methyltransferase 1